MKSLLNGEALINLRGLSMDCDLFSAALTECAGIFTNKYWFEYIALSKLCIMVMVSGIIKSVQMV